MKNSSESGIEYAQIIISEFQNVIETILTNFNGVYSTSPLFASDYVVTADVQNFVPIPGFSSSVSVMFSSSTAVDTTINFPMQSIDNVPPQIFEVFWDSCQRQITIVFEPNHGIDPNGFHDLSLVEVRDLDSNRHFSLERNHLLEISSDHITLELKKKHFNQLEKRMTSPTLTAFDGAFVDESGNRSKLTTDIPIVDVCI